MNKNPNDSIIRITSGIRTSFCALLLMLGCLTELAAAIDLGFTLTANPASPPIYSNTTITLEVQNHGTTSGSNIHIKMALPQNLAFVGQTVSKGTYDSWSGNWTIPALAANEKATINLILFTLTADPVVLNAQLTDSQPSDENTANNSASFTLNDSGSGATLPDLVVQSVNNAGSVNPGDSILISAVFKNTGTAGAGASAGEIFISIDNQPGADDLSLGTLSVKSLAVNEAVSLQKKVKLPAGLPPGNYFILVEADTGQVVLEKNEVNNFALANITLLGSSNPSNGSDLELSMNVSNSSPFIFTNVTVFLKIKNNGTSAASGIKVNFGLPSGLAFTTQVVPSGTSYNFWEGLWTIPALAPGQEKELQVVLFTLGTSPVTFFAQVTACSQNDNDSTPNNNNTGTPVEDDEAGLTINAGSAGGALPDLIVGIVTVEPQISPGDFLSFDIKARNVGSGNAGAHKLKYYLSADNTLSANDLLIGFEDFSGISANNFVPVNKAVQIPVSVTPGDYFLIFKADADNQIAETNESNNLNTKQVQVTSDGGGLHSIDLELSMTATPATFQIYNYVNFKLTLENRGPDEATFISVKFPVPQGLAYDSKIVGSGTYNQFTEKWDIPSLPAGASVEMELKLFTLQNVAYAAFAQVVLVSQIDSDSSPDNNAGTTPVEDDEAAFTIHPQNIAPRSSADDFEKETSALTGKTFSVYKVYPNPARDYVNVIFFSKKETLDFIIFNQNGQIVKTGKIYDAVGLQEHTFEISELPAGNYYIFFPTGSRPSPVHFTKIGF